MAAARLTISATGMLIKSNEVLGESFINEVNTDNMLTFTAIEAYSRDLYGIQ